MTVEGTGTEITDGVEEGATGVSEATDTEGTGVVEETEQPENMPTKI